MIGKRSRGIISYSRSLLSALRLRIVDHIVPVVLSRSGQSSRELHLLRYRTEERLSHAELYVLEIQ